MAIRLADFFGAGQEGRQAARDDQTRKGLASYFQGDQGALGQVYANSPEVAFRAEGMVDERRAAALDRFGKVATAFAQTKDPALYAQVRQGAQGLLGPAAAGMPETLDDPGDLDGAVKAATAWAQAYGGGVKEPEQFTLAPGSARYGADGKLLVQQPFAPDKPDYTWDSTRAVWIPKPGQETTYGGPVGSPIGSPNPQDQYASIGDQFGFQTTSTTRTPEQNRNVNGVPNSQHVTGTARDWSIKGKTPEQVNAFITGLRDQGFEAFQHDAGSGMHVHAELPPNRRAPQGGLSAIPVAGVAPKADDGQKPSEFERKLILAKQMGATDDQLRQMVLGESGGGKPSATQIKLANTAKQKLIDLTAMEDQLAKVEGAFKPLAGSWSAGLGGGMVPSVQGKQFDAAVALLKGMARKLTRTPGEGAMSDYESKLAELANPSRGEYEDVTADQIQQLRALITTTRQGYEALLQDAGGSTDNLPGQNRGGPQPGTVEAGYRFKGGNPADQNNWERI